MLKDKTKARCVNIDFYSDGFRLRGILHMPFTQAPPVVIGSHGLLSDSNSPKQIALAKYCNTNGIGFFRFDHRGCGKSSGVFHEITTLKARCNDLTAAIKVIQKRVDTSQQIGLFGSSLGGATCISVAGELHIDTLVTFAAPVNNRSIVDAVKETNNYTLDDLLFYQKKLQFNISDKLSKINNILIFHGDSDNVVNLSNAKKIYTMASGTKKIIIQKGGDHSMSNPDHQKKFVKEAVHWFKTGFSKSSTIC